MPIFSLAFEFRLFELRSCDVEFVYWGAVSRGWGIDVMRWGFVRKIRRLRRLIEALMRWFKILSAICWEFIWIWLVLSLCMVEFFGISIRWCAFVFDWFGFRVINVVIWSVDIHSDAVNRTIAEINVNYWIVNPITQAINPVFFLINGLLYCVNVSNVDWNAVYIAWNAANGSCVFTFFL